MRIHVGDKVLIDPDLECKQYELKNGLSLTVFDLRLRNKVVTVKRINEQLSKRCGYTVFEIETGDELADIIAFPLNSIQYFLLQRRKQCDIK